MFGKRRKHVPVTDPERDRRLTRVQTPTLKRHRIYRWKGRDEAYLVWHRSWCDVQRFGGPLDRVIEDCRRREDERDRLDAAFETGDPLAPCREGWHVHEKGFWFHLQGVFRSDGTARNRYLFGGAPGTCWTRWVVAPEPFECSTCGEVVDATAGVSEEVV